MIGDVFRDLGEVVRRDREPVSFDEVFPEVIILGDRLENPIEQLLVQGETPCLVVFILDGLRGLLENNPVLGAFNIHME